MNGDYGNTYRPKSRSNLDWRRSSRSVSVLGTASRANPRNLPCPTCKEPNKLTPADVRKHYQCDDCANREEGVG